MKNKQLIIVSALFIFILGFYLASNYTKPKNTEKIVYKEVEKEVYPECVADICPSFYQIDATMTNKSPETAIIIPLAMTQGFGKLVIVEEGGKKLFDSGGLPGVGVKPVKEGSGFILQYRSPRDENLNAVNYEDRYNWVNGEFVKE